MSHGRIVHLSAGEVDARWLGITLTVTTADGRTHTGGLSDVFQHPTHGRTLLWLGGQQVDVRQDTTVTVDSLGVIGGAA